jgi:hypothetical protein
MDFRLGYQIELDDRVTRRLGMMNRMLTMLPPGFRQAAAAAVTAGRIMGRAMAGVKNFVFSLKGLVVGGLLGMGMKGLAEQAAKVQDQVTGFATLLSVNDLLEGSQARQLQGAAKLNEAYKQAAQVREQTMKIANDTALTDDEALTSVQQVLGLSKSLGKGTRSQKIDIGTRIGELAKLLVPGINSAGMASEVRGLLTGEGLRNSQVAAGLGLQSGKGKQELQAAIKQGKVIDFLLEKTKDLSKFREKAGDNFNIQASTLEATVDRIRARMGKGMTERLTGGIKQAVNLLSGQKAADWADAVGKRLGDLTTQAITFGTTVVKMWPQISDAITPFVTGLINAGRWTWDLGVKVAGILWPSLQRLTTAIFGADGAGSKLWPSIQTAAETILPLAASGLAWMADSLASVINFAAQHQEIVKMGAALAIAFKVTPGMIALLGWLVAPTGMIQSFNVLKFIFMAMPGYLATVGASFATAAIPIAAMAATVYGLIKIYERLKEAQKQDEDSAVNAAEEQDRSSQLRKAGRTGMAARMRAGTMTEADIRMLRRMDPEVQAHLARRPADYGKSLPKVDMPISTGEIKLDGVVDKDKLKAELMKAQQKQLDDAMAKLDLRIRSGGRPSTLAPGLVF